MSAPVVYYGENTHNLDSDSGWLDALGIAISGAAAALIQAAIPGQKILVETVIGSVVDGGTTVVKDNVALELEYVDSSTIRIGDTNYPLDVAIDTIVTTAATGFLLSLIAVPAGAVVASGIAVGALVNFAYSIFIDPITEGILDTLTGTINVNFQVKGINDTVIGGALYRDGLQGTSPIDAIKELVEKLYTDGTVHSFTDEYDVDMVFGDGSSQFEFTFVGDDKAFRIYNFFEDDNHYSFTTNDGTAWLITDHADNIELAVDNEFPISDGGMQVHDVVLFNKNEVLIGGVDDLNGDGDLAGGSGQSLLIGRGFLYHSTLDGGAGDDYIYGNVGEQILIGGLGDDILYGDGYRLDAANHGNDTIIGGFGEDYSFGGAGDDTFEYLMTRDSVDGDYYHGGQLNVDLASDGTDTVDYSRFTADLTFDLQNTANNGAFVYTNNAPLVQDQLVSIEHYIGGDGDDTFRLWNTAYASVLSFSGSAGSDTVDYGLLSAPIDVDLNAGTDSLGNTLTGIENVILAGSGGNIQANSGDNKIQTGDVDSHINAEAGDDEVTTGAGNDIIDGGTGSNILHSGSGDDELSFAVNGTNDYSQAFGGDGFDYFSATGTGMILNNGSVLTQSGTAEGIEAIKINSGPAIHIDSMGWLFDYEGGGRLMDYSTIGQGLEFLITGTQWTVSETDASPLVDTYINTANLSNNHYAIPQFVGTDYGDIVTIANGYGYNSQDYVYFYSGTGDDVLTNQSVADVRYYYTGGHDDLSNISWNWSDQLNFLGDIDASDISFSHTVTSTSPLPAGFTRVNFDLVINVAGKGSITMDNLHGSVDNGDDNIYGTADDIYGSFYGNMPRLYINGVWVQFDSNTQFAFDNPPTYIQEQGTYNGDNISGTSGNETLNGLGGNDTISAGSGDDTLNGGRGNDTLHGEAGIDTLRGGFGNDTLRGGDDRDTLLGDQGDDTLYGGEGNDRLFGGSDNDTLHGEAGADDLYGGFGDDILHGGDEQDDLQGGDGDDTLHGGGDNDDLYGEDGNDTLHGDLGDDHLEGDDGDDTLYGGAGNDVLHGEDGNDALNGDEGDDTLRGGAGNDILSGQDGNDLLEGGDGDDTLRGGAGMDTLRGEAGADTYILGAGFGSPNGGDRINTEAVSTEIDRIVFESASSLQLSYYMEGYDLRIQYGSNPDNSVVIDAGGNYTNGSDVFDRIEEFEFSNGSVMDLSLGGLELDDTANGTGTVSQDFAGTTKNDIILGAEAPQFHYYEIYAGDGDDIVYGGDRSDQYTNYRYEIHGGSGNDELYGGDNAEDRDYELYGEDGNDKLVTGTGQWRLFGGTGDDEYVLGSADFEQVTITEGLGEGFDTLEFASGIHPSDLYVWTDNGRMYIRLQDDATKQINLGGSSSNYETDIGNRLEKITFASSVTEWDWASEGIHILAPADQSNSIITGSEFDDVIDGNGGNDTISGGRGDDTIYGGRLNNDGVTYESTTLDYSLAPDRVLVNLSNNVEVDGVVVGSHEAIDGDGGKDTLIGDFYQVYGSAHDDGIWGDDLNNLFYGYAGDDELEGHAGNDLLHGGLGDDDLSGGDGNDDLYGEEGNDELSGGAGNDRLYGDEGNDVLEGGDGNDTIYSGSGNDTIRGGAGYDQVIFDEPNTNGVSTLINMTGSIQTYQTITLAGNTVRDSWGDNDTIESIESVTGSDYDDLIWGPEDMSGLTVGQRIQIYGHYGDDLIFGGNNDSIDFDPASGQYEYNQYVLFGEGGDDIIYGGDLSATGQFSDYIIYGGLGGDTIYGGDRLVQTDNNSDYRIYGGAGNDIIHLGSNANAGWNSYSVWGDDDDDTYIVTPQTSGFIYVNEGLNGGFDTLEIGGGILPSDVYVWAQGGDLHIQTKSGDLLHLVIEGEATNPYQTDVGLHLEQIIFTAGGGTTWDLTTMGFTMQAPPSQNDGITGTAFDDVIDGNGGYDVLSGGGGNDTIYGDGDTSLNYRGSAAGVELNVSGISQTGSSGIVAHNSAIVGDGSQDTLIGDFRNLYASEHDDRVWGNAAANDIYGYEGNDRLYGFAGWDDLRGGEGDDYLEGGEGDDDLRGDQGADTIIGGLGRDEIFFNTNGSGIIVNLSFSIQSHEAISQAANSAQDGWGNTDIITEVEDAYGTGHDDIMWGNAERNLLRGNSGNDVLYGFAGNDNLYGGDGDDTLQGGLGNDTYYYETGNDTIFDAGGIDLLDLPSGVLLTDLSLTQNGDDLSITVTGHGEITIQDYFVSPHHRIETIRLSDNSSHSLAELAGVPSIIYGSEGDDTISGTAGEDEIHGFGGDDTIYGGAGDDLFFGGSGRNIFNGGQGIDTVSYENNSIGVNGSIASSAPFPLPNLDENYATMDIDGDGNADDEIRYDIENIIGSAHNDTIAGNSVANILQGGAGGDTLSGGIGDDILDGGDGIDTASYIYSAHGVYVDLAAGEADDNGYSGAWSANETLISIENVMGSNHDDELRGSSEDNYIQGGSGNDTLGGGAGGNDVLEGGLGDDTYVIDAGSGIKTVQENIGEGTDTILIKGILPTSVYTWWNTATNNAHLQLGSSPDNQIIIESDLSDPEVTGYLADIYLRFEQIAFDINADGITDYTQTFTNGAVLQDNDESHTNVGTVYGDNISGNGGDDTLYGLAGDDILNGGTGNDVIIGGAGDDILTGADGDDVYRYNLGDGVDTISDTFGSDIIEFGAGITQAELGFSQNGNDAIIHIPASGSITIENYFLNNDLRVETIQFSDNSTLDLGTVSFVTSIIYGSNDPDYINGTENADLIYGLDGDDSISALGGDDIVYGGSGNDNIHGYGGSSENAHNSGNDTLYGEEGDDYLSGYFGGNSLLDGGVGNDTLDYGYNRNLLNTDLYKGGAGLDELRFRPNNYTDITAAMDIDFEQLDQFMAQNYDENSTDGPSFTFSSVDLTVSDVEHLVVSVGLAAIYYETGLNPVTGTAANDILTGTAARDRILGLEGDDIFIVNGEGDTHIGGSGNDTIDFSTMGSSAFIALEENVAFFPQLGGHFTSIFDIENIIGTDYDDTINGDEVDNVLSGGAGDDSLSGGTGDDTYRYNLGDGFDTIVEAGGNDTIILGPGIDLSNFNSYGDGLGNLRLELYENDFQTVIGAIVVQDYFENPDAQVETVKFTIDDGLGGAILAGSSVTGTEGNETLTGTEYFDYLRGRGGDDILYGGGGDDRVRGDGGNDHLYGEAGDDRLQGRTGDDTYYYNLGDGFDTIEESSGNDTIILGAGIDLSNFNSYGDGLGNLRLEFYENDFQTVIGAIVVQDYFLNPDAQVETVKFSQDDGMGGTILTGSSITGTEAGETLTGTEYFDYLRGRGGNDTLWGEDGDDRVRGDDGNDTLYGGTGNDLIQGRDDHDNLYGEDGNDTLEGDNGNDYLDGGIGDDYLDGGAGNDSVYGGDGNDTITETAGVDNLHGGNGNDTITGAELFGTTDYHIYGDAGDDVVYGGDNNGSSHTADYYIYGGTGNDELHGGYNHDNNSANDISYFLFGEDGDDQLIANDGGRWRLFGGDGNDTLSYENITNGVIVYLNYNNTGYGRGHQDGNEFNSTFDDLNSIENLITTDYNDILIGDAQANILTGLAGDDFLRGNEGDDMLYGGDGNDTIQGGDGNDALHGGEGDDTIYGQNGNDILGGGAGRNTLTDSGGDETYIYASGIDTIDDFGGNDTIEMTPGLTQADVTFYQSGDDAVLYIDGNSFITIEDHFSGGSNQIETLSFSDNTTLDLTTVTFGDAIFGTQNSDTLSGDENDNIIYGLEGDDIFLSDAGNDTLDGGLGVDTIDFSAVTSGVVVNLIGASSLYDGINTIAANTAYDGLGGTDTIYRVENIIGSEYDDYVNLSNLYEGFVDGGAGNDSLLGGALADVLRGDEGDDILIGNGGDDEIDGGAGNDQLHGSGGSDTLHGGEGDDLFTDLIDSHIDGGDGYDYARFYNEDEGVEINFQTGTLLGLVSGDSGSITNVERIIATVYDDVVIGGDGDDYLHGYYGYDILHGGDGNDDLRLYYGGGEAYGGNGNDVIYGSIDVDLVYGGAGNDVINTYTGNDTIFGGDGNDSIHTTVEAQLDGGDGTADTVLFHNSSIYGVFVDLASGMMSDTNGAIGTITNIERVRSTNFDDNVTGDASHNHLISYGGNDILYGGAGRDYIDGGDGDDIIYGGDGDDKALWENGVKVIEASLIGGLGNDIIYGEGGADRIVGQAGEDTLHGGDDNDYVYGGDDDDILHGDGGVDRLYGDGGNDTIYGGTETDHLYGGDGNDEMHGDAGNDRLWGHLGDDTLYGGIGNDYLGGMEGDDVIDGGDGTDIVFYTMATSAVTIDLMANGMTSGTATGGIETGTDTLIDIENIEASDYDDIITGNDISNVIRGHDGDDTIHGAGGDDILHGDLGTDVLYGGLGNDTFYANSNGDTAYGEEGDDYFYATADAHIDGGADRDKVRYSVESYGVTVNLDTGITSNTNGDTGTVANIESVAGSGYDDTITGGAGDDTLDGAAGNDTIYGGDGADYIVGNYGDDILYGGDGDDDLRGNDGIDIYYGENGNDFLLGGQGDSLYGGAGNDQLRGYGGTGHFDGGADTDKVWWRNYAHAGNIGLNIDLTAGTVTDGDSNVATIVNIESIVGSSYADFIRGTAGDDVLQGGSDTYGDVGDEIHGEAGMDVIYGRGGDDTLYGGDGNDEMYGNGENDTMYGDNGDDVVYGGIGDDTIYGGAGHDDLRGQDGNDIIYGGDGDDHIYEVGYGGNDTFYGDAGNDVINTGFDATTAHGGTGDDTINGSDGNDTINGDEDDDELRGYGGNDTINGGTGSDWMHGGAGMDILTGGDGVDTLWGGDDDDILHGDAGNDTLYGEAGNDTLYGGAGDDDLRSYDGDDILYGGDGNDMFYDVTFGTGNDTYYGEGGNDIVIAESGLNMIHGGDGEDDLRGGSDADTINGDADNDSLQGFAGDDTLSGGLGDDWMDGGAGNDMLYGGDGLDQLYGRDGDDMLYGGVGDDRMTGGAGADTFILAGGGNNTIYDFSTVEGDVIDISDILSGYTSGVDDITDFVQITDNGQHSYLSVDADGGGDSFVQISMLANVTGLTDEAALETAGNLITV